MAYKVIGKYKGYTNFTFPNGYHTKKEAEFARKVAKSMPNPHKVKWLVRKL